MEHPVVLGVWTGLECDVLSERCWLCTVRRGPTPAVSLCLERCTFALAVPMPRGSCPPAPPLACVCRGPHLCHRPSCSPICSPGSSAVPQRPELHSGPWRFWSSSLRHRVSFLLCPQLSGLCPLPLASPLASVWHIPPPFLQTNGLGYCPLTLCLCLFE